MPHLDRRSLYFLGLFFFIPSSASASPEKAVDLERITVLSRDKDYTGRYSLGSEVIQSLSYDSPIQALTILPLDLSSRRLQSDIQTDFSMRGSDFEGVAVTLNGKRINDPQTGHHNSDIPLTSQDIERMSLDPGGIYSSSASGAIGGALNIKAKRPKEDSAFLEASGGSHNSYSGLFSMTKKTGRLASRLSLERSASSGFRDDTDYKKLTGTFRSFWEEDDKSLDLGFGYQQKEFGAYDFYTPGMGFPSKEWTRTYLLDSSFSLDKGALSITPSFLWRRHFDKFILDKTGLRSKSTSAHRTDVYTPALYFSSEPTFLGTPELGLEYGEERITSTTIGSHHREHKAIVLNDTLELGSRASLRFSFRGDHYNHMGEFPAFSFDLRYALFEHDYLRLSLYRQVRLPSFTELYYSDSTTQGDPGLTGQKALGYEAGYVYKKGALSFGSALFLREEEDVIDWVKHTPSQAKWRAENISDAEVFGTEDHIALELSKNILLSSNYAYTQKKRDKRDLLFKYGPNYARHIFNTSLNFNSSRFTSAISSTYKKKPGRRGWFLLGISSGYILRKDCQLFLDITNLLNVEYQEIEGVPEAGRIFEAGLRLSW